MTITVGGRKASASQQAMIRRALAYADKVGAPRKAKVALLEALTVETGARHLPYGHADSEGVLQARVGIHGRLSPEQQFDKFLRRGFTGAGGAIKLSRTGMKSGDIAQAVQGSAFPDRYGKAGAEARRNLAQLGGRGSVPGRTTPIGARVAAASVETPQAPAADILGQILSRRRRGGLLDKLGLLEEQEAPTPEQSAQPTSPDRPRSPQGGPGRGRFSASELKELIYRGPGGVTVDEGKRVPRDFFSKHLEHVHAAAGPKRTVQLGKLAQKMGLHVGENPNFGGVAPVHTQGSYHYRPGGQAIDVSGDPRKMAAYARTVARMFGV